WLRRYLTMGSERPTWAFLVDVLINRATLTAHGKVPTNAQVNTYIQSWRPSTSYTSDLPRYIKRMLKAGTKNNVSFAAIKLDNELKLQLPIWYHLNATAHLRRLDNTKASVCLPKHHGVDTVRDLVKAVHEQMNPTTGRNKPHSLNNKCKCEVCETIRRNGCQHPETCRAAARRILDRLSKKWQPLTEPQQDGLTLTHHRAEKNIAARENKKEALTLDPTVTCRGGITEAFRAFV
ncbi:hypothetical protein FOMPIDRAFT_1105654, partial [Fomitopsis schrenkii]